MSTNFARSTPPVLIVRTLAQKLLRSSDAALAMGVLAMIGLMILPVRPWMLDIFLTLNLALGGVLLMAAVLTPTATRIFTFPTLLIVTTLFRLALDVSSTRLILTEGNAGYVIQSFGQFAASGSVVVGLVVFLIITMVQLIVISKGAERTANASATFVRDSIPGRQMAIEADANSGRINPADVTKARREMGIEVEFYSRMYGAMEFIKGDSIAGLVIAAINIVGGLIVGVAVNHMSVLNAVETYTLLTVGAGLVSQIPALIGSVAGTILVSRVSTDDAEGGLGLTAAGQVKALPEAMMGSAVLMLLLGVVPGMPTFTFLAFAAILGYTGIRLRRNRVNVSPPPATPSLLEFRLNPSKLSEEETLRIGEEGLVTIKHFRANSGILVGMPSFVSVVKDDLPAIEFCRAGLKEVGGDSWEAVKVQLLEHLFWHPARSFGIDAALLWTEVARMGSPAGANLLDKSTDLKSLYRILSRLVEERITIKDTRSIVQALMLSETPLTKRIADPQKYADVIRTALIDQAGRYYKQQYLVSGRSDLYVTQPGGEIAIGMNELAAGSPDAYDRVVKAITSAFGKRNTPGVPIVVIDEGSRRALWEICERLFQVGELPKPVLVLSRAEAAAPALKTLTPTAI